MHTVHINTKALHHPSIDIITICAYYKNEKKERKRKEKDWAFDSFYFLQERDNILSKACHKKSARISGTHHIHIFSEVETFGLLFFQ